MLVGMVRICEMNYYQHHIGDFNNATRHLSRIERSIYRDLLELYYDTELPLTSDFERLARRCLVAECDMPAMRDVLNEFFMLRDDGYHNNRADIEIAAYKRMAEGGKRGADKRWGGNTPSIATPSPPYDKANANQEPITNNQEPLKTKEKQTPSALLASLEISETVAQDFISLRNRLKAPITKTALAGIQREADKAGITLQDALQVCCERSWRGFNAEWVKPKTNAPPVKSNVQDARLDCLNQIFRKGEYGTDRQIIDITPASSNQSDRACFPEAIACVWEPATSEVAGDEHG